MFEFFSDSSISLVNGIKNVSTRSAAKEAYNLSSKQSKGNLPPEPTKNDGQRKVLLDGKGKPGTRRNAGYLLHIHQRH